MITDDYLAMIARQEKQFDALYRNAGALFNIPDCAMWVLYFVASSQEVLSQQDLINQMMFPKQTINSAVAGLQKKGLLELVAIPGTRNRKKIILTEVGHELVSHTVARMRQAECQAVEQMGFEKMEQYIALYQEFYSHLHDQFIKEGVLHE